MPAKKAKSAVNGPRLKFKARIWIYEGKAAWHFVTLPKGESARLKKAFGGMAGGWGSLRVLATLGASSWLTSIFPDGKRRAYLLPLKKEVRAKEKALAGQARDFSLELQL